jgi:hypothetical protein
MIELISLEVNDLIIGKINLLDVGIMKISHITIQLEENEIKLQKDFDNYLKLYIESSYEYPSQDNDIVKNYKELAKQKFHELNKIKFLRSRWNMWFNEIFSYH